MSYKTEAKASNSQGFIKSGTNQKDKSKGILSPILAVKPSATYEDFSVFLHAETEGNNLSPSRKKVLPVGYTL